MENQVTSLVFAKAKAALLAPLVGEALAMPVHWFYDTNEIQKLYGYIKDYQPAAPSNPSGFMQRQPMKITNSDGTEKEIFLIGDVIMKGQQEFWVKGLHYHHGLKAGENSLSGQMLRFTMRVFSQNTPYDEKAFLTEYVKFLTADSPQYNDVFADSYHRNFFTNFAKGEDILKCGATHTGGDALDVCAMAIPLLVRNYVQTKDRKSSVELAQKHVQIFTPNEPTTQLAEDLANLLIDLLENDNPKNVRAPLVEAAKKYGIDLPQLKDDVDKKFEGKDEKVAGDLYKTGCVINGAWPIVLYLAYKYLDPENLSEENVTKALLQNVNVGGDNVNRGTVLGSILGSAIANEKNNFIAKNFIDGLVHKDSILKEIDEYLL